MLKCLLKAPRKQSVHSNNRTSQDSPHSLPTLSKRTDVLPSSWSILPKCPKTTSQISACICSHPPWYFRPLQYPLPSSASLPLPILLPSYVIPQSKSTCPPEMSYFQKAGERKGSKCDMFTFWVPSPFACQNVVLNKCTEGNWYPKPDNMDSLNHCV